MKLKNGKRIREKSYYLFYNMEKIFSSSSSSSSFFFFFFFFNKI